MRVCVDVCVCVCVGVCVCVDTQASQTTRLVSENKRNGWLR